MEVLLEAASGIPPDAVVSLRLGPTRRQAPLQSALSHPLRFTTTLDDACEPLRVDVMRPLASARVVLRAEELRYSVPLEGKQDMALRLKVKPAKAPTEDAVPACHPDPEETEASLAGQRQEPEEPAPEGTGVLATRHLRNWFRPLCMFDVTREAT
eukprot:g27295.t1